MRLLSLLLFVWIGSSLPASVVNAAQDPEPATVVRDCLVVATGSYAGRSILAVDPVQQQLVSGEWVPPRAATPLTTAADQVPKWEAITADTDGWFVHPALDGGYAYVSMTVDRERTVLLECLGATFVFIDRVPRIGSKYATSDSRESWQTRFDFGPVPVLLAAGEHHLLLRCTRGRLKVKLSRRSAPVFLEPRDMTLPDLMVGERTDAWGAVLLVNADQQLQDDLVLTVKGAGLTVTDTPVPVIQPYSVRKVAFRVQGTAPAVAGPQRIELQLSTAASHEVLASQLLELAVRGPGEAFRRTFRSGIDGSVQYYAVNPARSDRRGELPAPADRPAALVLSVHGASVEALNQANAYAGKSWAHIVAPTNRRPYGYDWEDWGRLDALEVLADAARSLGCDTERVYLTGHSMGGHGAWQLAVSYPDRFAAVGPSAGWISFATYAPRDTLATASPAVALIARSRLPGDTLALVDNLRHLGVYILHGDADTSVPVDQARQMAAHLAEFHHDFQYHEEPGAGHWWDLSDEPGVDCVDWVPMFDFFARHVRSAQQRLRQVDFVTANPGVSASCYWLTIAQQEHALRPSRAGVRHDPGRRRYVGATVNVARLGLALGAPAGGDTFTVELDGQNLSGVAPAPTAETLWLVRSDQTWRFGGPSPAEQKNPRRYGTFKDVLRHDVVLVFGTQGSAEQNGWARAKARFDAEALWYQGNGSVDVVADVAFDAAAEPDRSVILYGNAETNAAWAALLGDSPVQVYGGEVRVGGQRWRGDDLACLLIRPRPGSDIASVGAVSGSGLTGMRLTTARPYLYSGYALPDWVVFSADAAAELWYEAVPTGVLAAGFFGLDWSLESGESAWR